MGTYGCKEGNAVVAEQELPTDPNTISMPTDPNVDPYAEFNTSIQFNWTKRPVTATAQQKPKYSYKEDFPFTYMTKNPKIAEIQKAIGMEQRYQTGNFGPITQKALLEKGYDTTQGITQELYNKIITTATPEAAPATRNDQLMLNLPSKEVGPVTGGAPASKTLAGSTATNTYPEPAPETNRESRIADRIDRLAKRR